MADHGIEAVDGDDVDPDALESGERDEEPTRARMGIVARTVLLTAAIAAIAVILAGVIAYPLVRSSTEARARAELDALTDITATALMGAGGDNDHPHPLPRPVMESLRSKSIEGYLMGPAGPPPEGLTREQVSEALEGEGAIVVAESRGTFLVEARTLGDGTIVVLTQPYSVVGGQADDALRRLGLALLAGLIVAVPIGWIAARRLTRPLRAARDAANAMAAGARDVTLRPSGPAEIADISEALNHLNRALVVSEGRQREFLLSVSHELRTPLTAVKGYAEALSDGVIDPADAPRTGQVVAGEAARLDRLVTDLLDLARLGAVDFHVTPIDVDLCEVADDAATVWTDRAEREGLTLRAEIPREPIRLRTDPLRVRQIIDNLCENALRVSRAGSVIVVSVRQDATDGIVEIRDSGPGLSDDDLAIAFEPGALYERYRGERPVGTGLGLALVGRLARGLGGTAQAGRAPEGGACFTVRLPRDRRIVTA